MKKLKSKKLFSYLIILCLLFVPIVFFFIISNAIELGKIYPEPLYTSKFLMQLILALAVFLIILISSFFLKKKTKSLQWISFIILIAFIGYKSYTFIKYAPCVSKLALINNEDFSKFDVNFFDRHNTVFKTNDSENPIYIVTLPLNLFEYRESTNKLIKRSKESIESGEITKAHRIRTIKERIEHLNNNFIFYDFLSSCELTWVYFHSNKQNIKLSFVELIKNDICLETLDGPSANLHELQKSILHDKKSRIVLLIPEKPGERILKKAKENIHFNFREIF